MEHKHTPGPWTVEPPSDSEPDYDKREKDYWSIRAPGPNDCVSHEVARLSGWNIDRDEHTARLIAAAPELLALLSTLECDINTLVYCYERRPDNFAGALSVAKENAERAARAIAKATGATHE